MTTQKTYIDIYVHQLTKCLRSRLCRISTFTEFCQKLFLCKHGSVNQFLFIYTWQWSENNVSDRKKIIRLFKFNSLTENNI